MLQHTFAIATQVVDRSVVVRHVALIFQLASFYSINATFIFLSCLPSHINPVTKATQLCNWRI